eukprot:jgi/Galph1/1415/GphlegSOOS_G107.1
MGSFYGLAYVMEGRVQVKEARDRMEGFPEELAKELKIDVSNRKKKSVSLEDEYEKVKGFAAADYENKAVPGKN